MFYTTRIGPTFRRTKPCDKTFCECSMIMKQLDTPGNSRPIILYDNTTGGQACAPLSNITSLAVAFASNSRLTDPRLTWPFSLSLALLLLVLSPTAPWTLLLTYLLLTDLTPFWSW